MDEGKAVYIMGDSAGGNIALGLMYTIKEEGWEKPEKMVVIAPCSDMWIIRRKSNQIILQRQEELGNG